MRPGRPVRIIATVRKGIEQGSTGMFSLEVLVITGLVLLSVVTGIILSVRSRRSRDTEELPMLFFAPANGGVRAAARVVPAAPPAAVPEPSRPVEQEAAPLAVPERVRRGALARPAAPQPSASRVAPAALPELAPAPEDAETIRFSPRDVDMVQLLPGRLEVVGGEIGRREIRFLKSYANPDCSFTLGRRSGASHEHIQLKEPTVSRIHARMRFHDGGWRLANLSGTNPVVVNGVELTDVEREHVLRDGDRIEMGELAFLYRDGAA
jgi:hypothetical protein